MTGQGTNMSLSGSETVMFTIKVPNTRIQADRLNQQKVATQVQKKKK